MELQIKEIHKSFGEKKVLDNISLSASGGHALGLLGRNGAGKTTTIRIIMGVFPPDSGRVMLDGAGIDRDRVKIGYMPEEHGLYPRIVIKEQLMYLALLRGMAKNDAKASIKHWLERLEMDSYANSKLMTLSKGNQQKIQLVATLITDPSMIILDEPFSGLDPVNSALLKDAVRELISKGKIVLFSSHQMSYVEEFCEHIAILHQGKIVLDGEISEIKRSYDRSQIELRARSASAIEDFCLKRLSGFVLNTSLADETLIVKLRGADDKNDLIKAVSEQGFDIDRIGVCEPSLNDIFVQYTGDERKEDEKFETA